MQFHLVHPYMIPAVKIYFANIFNHHSPLRPNHSQRLIDVQFEELNIVHGAMMSHDFAKILSVQILENLNFFENSLRNDCETF